MRMVPSAPRPAAARTAAALAIIALFLSAPVVFSQALPDYFDIIGVNLLRATTTNLDGSGVRVAQVEAQEGSGQFEVTPANTNINLPVSDFTWYSAGSSATTFPNSLGTDSPHSDAVGGYFYGLPDGVSTNVAHIDNFEAGDYYETRVPDLNDPDTNARVVNQSFDDTDVSDQNPYDQYYDNYAAKFNVLFITGVGDGGHVMPPSTCYNGIGVSAYYNTNGTSIGPTVDNGRAKPDITAPQAPTSYSTPLVSGAAAILLEAGSRGDGGSDTNSPRDARTLKALLLNGAIKPATWSNPSPSPLDPLFGAGILDVFESYHQLLGGKHGCIATTTVATNAAHPPTGATGNVSVLSGWDFNAITNSATTDVINHYCFGVTNSAQSTPFTGTITLVWNRQYSHSTINNLDLFLYDMNSGSLIASSTSQVDNVEHIYVPQLPAGRYDLEVLKHGGGAANFTTASETYALAFEFFAMQLTVTPSPGGVTVSWPIYPDGFYLESAPSLTPPIAWWGTGITPTVTNGSNYVFLSSASGPQFFQLYRFRNP